MGEAGRRLKVAVFGATGVAGLGVVQACLGEDRVDEVRAVVRRPTGADHAKLREVQCDDFERLPGIAEALEGVDAVYYCLGRAVSQVSGEAEYRKLTFDYALAIANKLAVSSPQAVLHFVSGQGTNPKSRMMWARIKGETELALADVELGGLVCWRPGMILADEIPSGLPWSYRVAYPIIRMLYFIPSLAVKNVALGHAMLQLTFEDKRSGVLENADIRGAAFRYEGVTTG